MSDCMAQKFVKYSAASFDYRVPSVKEYYEDNCFFFSIIIVGELPKLLVVNQQSQENCSCFRSLPGAQNPKTSVCIVIVIMIYICVTNLALIPAAHRT